METATNKNKPLGHKAYGSIPHLVGSRVGPSDYHAHEGQQRIATEKARDRHDIIIVQEKLDGSNVSVARVNGEILAITRAGYLAETSPFEQHHHFAKWVDKNKSRFIAVLKDGERIAGEWLLQAHGTRYNLPHEPFVPFDIIRNKHERATYSEMESRLADGFILPALIHIGGPLPIDEGLANLNPATHGAIDPIEGAVWRVERKGVVDFLVKFVRPEKKDGIYLPELSDNPPVWNYDFNKL